MVRKDGLDSLFSRGFATGFVCLNDKRELCGIAFPFFVWDSGYLRGGVPVFFFAKLRKEFSKSAERIFKKGLDKKALACYNIYDQARKAQYFMIRRKHL